MPGAPLSYDLLSQDTPSALIPPKSAWIRVLLAMDDSTSEPLYREFVYDTDRPRGGLISVMRSNGQFEIWVSARPRCWIDENDIKNA